ncbi:MAG: molecular chaperone HtpG, partial [Polyangiaceae bacterium]|nr:molecular chaperone HtpG [Polyangiaceae bacterium]
HVKRVFIMDDCEELLPRFLRFVRGIIDSEDLPLNVSREILQDSRIVQTMRKQVVKRALDMIEELSKTEGYAEWWGGFGAVLKEGLHFETDAKDRERIAKLVRYESTKEEGLVSLEEYTKRMPLSQPAIYYVLGASKALVRNTPHLEVLRKKGYEVLFMTDPVDAWAVEGLHEFEGKPLVSAMDADLTLEGDAEGESARKEEDAKRLGPLLSKFQAVLGEKVSEVRVSDRLTDSAVCLVQPKGGLPPYLERVLRAQKPELAFDRRALELNPDHPLVESITKLHAKAPDDAQLAEWIEVLYDQALLAEGSPVEDPARLVQRMTALMVEAAAKAAAS